MRRMLRTILPGVMLLGLSAFAAPAQAQFWGGPTVVTGGPGFVTAVPSPYLVPTVGPVVASPYMASPYMLPAAPMIVRRPMVIASPMVVSPAPMMVSPGMSVVRGPGWGWGGGYVRPMNPWGLRRW